MNVLNSLSKELDRSISDEVNDLMFVQVDEDYDPVSGETTETTTEFSCKGHSQEISERFLGRTEVDMKDREMIIHQETLVNGSGNKIEPDTDDRVKEGSMTFDVVVVGKDPSDAIWKLVVKG